MTGLCGIYRMSECPHRVKVRDEQTPFVNCETDGLLKRENRKADGIAQGYLVFTRFILEIKNGNLSINFELEGLINF